MEGKLFRAVPMNLESKLVLSDATVTRSWVEIVREHYERQRRGAWTHAGWRQRSATFLAAVV